MAALTTSQTERLARKTERALTVATVLGVIEIVRRTPRWLLLLAAVVVATVILLALTYIIWTVVFLGAVVAWKLAPGFVRGWRETR
jgi:hypothetical protein